MLDMLAAFGLVTLLRRFIAERKNRWAFVLGVTAFLLATWYGYHPYAIAYHNPFVPEGVGQEVGWGEGLEQVGAWLDQRPTQPVVASWYPEELGAYTSARVAHINAHEQNRVQYVVLYRNMFGRAADHPANDFIDLYYKRQVPVFVAKVRDKEFAWVYEKRVYEHIAGELTPGVIVGQEFMIKAVPLARVDVAVATYSGKAKSGRVVVELKTERDGGVVRSWEVPLEDVEDGKWLQLSLPERRVLPSENVFVTVHAEGTSAGDAPTVRVSRMFDYRPTDYLFSSSGSFASAEQRAGDLAVRFVYDVNGELASEEDTKLLPP
jgi:hypothetical protein